MIQKILNKDEGLLENPELLEQFQIAAKESNEAIRTFINFKDDINNNDDI